MVGAMKKWLKAEWRTVADPRAGASVSLNELLGDDGHHCADAAVHQGGAKAAYHPQCDAVFL